MTPAAPMTWTARGAALGIAVACVVPLVVAASLVPSPTGMETHRQLGLPACTWPGMLGIPCISCGMTTAFALTVRGSLVAAFIVQPAGALLCLLAAMGAVVAAWSAGSGWPVHRFLMPLARPRTAWVAAAALVVAWGWKIACTRGGGA
jgi:hypothetical protein